MIRENVQGASDSKRRRRREENMYLNTRINGKKEHIRREIDEYEYRTCTVQYE